MRYLDKEVINLISFSFTILLMFGQFTSDRNDLDIDGRVILLHSWSEIRDR